MTPTSPDKSGAAQKPSRAPLTHGDVPEQDGSEDPGVGLPMIRDAELSEEKDKAQSKSLGPTSPPSPSALEHENRRGDLRVPEETARASKAHKTSTFGVGEGATVSHVDK